MSAFDKIYGYDSLKEKMIKTCDMLKNREKYKKLGATIPKGVLIHGGPGLGKTLIAECFIEECGLWANTIRRNDDDADFILHMKNIFELARKNTPSIVFLDDMDKYANGDEEHKNCKEYAILQTCIDQCKNDDVFIIATVNDTCKLPDSLQRHGRFDIKIGAECPDYKNAELIIRKILADKPLSDDVNIEDLSRMFNYSSCAQILTILNNAAIRAAYKNSSTIGMQDFVQAILEECNHREDKELEIADEKNQRIVAIHEIGHFLCHEHFSPNTIGSISIIPEGRTISGRVFYFNGKHEYIPDIVARLGGKAAEQIYFPNQLIEGGYHDLSSTYKKVEHIIRGEGMMGTEHITVRDGFEMSNESLFRLETVIHLKLEEFLAQAREIITKNKDLLEAILDELLDKKMLLYSDLQRIKKEHPMVP